MTIKMLDRTALSVAIAGALAFSAHAQERPNSQRELEEIVVTATMLERELQSVPTAVSVVGQNEIQLARQQLALDESLARVPGLFMQNRYNFAQDLRLSIRGFGARAQFGIRGIKVLVDGIPETLPDGQGGVDSIDLGTTSQIEVIRGPSSSMYGNASGGVISVTTEVPPSEPFAEARVATGKYGFQKLQVKGGGSGERANYLFSVSDQELDGFRQQSRAESRQLTGRIGVDLGNDREFLTTLNYTDQPVSDDPGGITKADAAANPKAAYPFNVTRNAGEALDQTRLGFVYSMPLGDGHSITARNYYIWRDFGNVLPIPDGGIVDLDRSFIGGAFNYSYEGTWLDRPNRLIVGVDFDDQDDDRLRYDNMNGQRGPLVFNQNERVKSQGVFIQNELSVSRDVLLTFGLRFDKVKFDVTDRYFDDGFDDSGSLEFDDTSPMVGLVFDIAPRATLYANYSTAFETPTTTELNKPDTSGGFNPNLDAQVARNLEVGARGVIGDYNRYELAVFSIDVDDELIPFEVPGTAGGRNYYENAGKSSRQGFEASLVSRPTDRLQTTVSYTYSDFTFDRFVDADNNNFSGKRIPGTTENVFFGEVLYEAPNGWFAAADVIYVGDQYADNANSAAAFVESYTVANLRAGLDIQSGDLRISPFIGVNNLFDEKYTANVRLNAFGGRFFEPAPGRNGYAGVTLHWGF